MKRLLLVLLSLLPLNLYAQGSGTPPYRGVNNWPLIFGTDNLYDIGAAGATRPRTGYFGTSVITPALTVSGLTSGRVPFATTGGLLSDSADQGVMLLSSLTATGGVDTSISIRSVADLAAADFALLVEDNNGTDLVWVTGGGALQAISTIVQGTSTSTRNALIDASGVVVKSGSLLGFGSSSTDAGGGADTNIARQAAGVLRCGASSSIRCLLGGGAAVASATALPVPTGGMFHVTGTTTITSLTTTNLATGICFTMIFDGALTVTDGNNLVLAGNFVTTAGDTLSGCFDGTNFYETTRSNND